MRPKNESEKRKQNIPKLEKQTYSKFLYMYLLSWNKAAKNLPNVSFYDIAAAL